MFKDKIRTLTIGLALFSMFFGSGNFIFPLFVGKESSSSLLIATLGFNITAALLPFLGVMTMIVFKGDYLRFFYKISKPLGFTFICALLIFWIPLGSAPRCITLSFAAFKPVLGDNFYLWQFSLLYSLIVYLMTYNRGKIIDLLGNVLTPMLLLTLGYIIFKGLNAESINSLKAITDNPFGLSIRQGYYTMDLIAAFFFSSNIIDMIKSSDKTAQNQSKTISQALKSGVIGLLILVGVYCGLIYLSYLNADVLKEVNKEDLFTTLCLHLLGAAQGSVAAVAIGFACLTTSIALASVFSDFLRQTVMQNKISHPKALFITTAVTYFISTLGFEKIQKISSPALDIFYPILLVLIFCIVPLELYKNKNS